MKISRLIAKSCHMTIRSTTAGEIRAGGGTVDYATEFNSNVGATNYQHVNVTVGEGNLFSEPFANPVQKSGRFGGPNYPFGGPDYPYSP